MLMCYLYVATDYVETEDCVASIPNSNRLYVGDVRVCTRWLQRSRWMTCSSDDVPTGLSLPNLTSHVTNMI